MSVPHDPRVPDLDDPVGVPLRLLLATRNVLARLDPLLADAEHEAILSERLYGLGAPDSNDQLPATELRAEAGQICDAQTARDYLHGLRDRLGDVDTFLEALGGLRQR